MNETINILIGTFLQDISEAGIDQDSFEAIESVLYPMLEGWEPDEQELKRWEEEWNH